MGTGTIYDDMIYDDMRQYKKPHYQSQITGFAFENFIKL